MKILVFGAHADDAEIGMGATIARYIAEGHDVKIVCAIIPHESKNGVVEIEKKEIRRLAAVRSAEILGAELDILDFDPYDFEVNRHYTKIFDQIVREYEPDQVYVSWHNDSHQDHKAIANIIFSSARKNNFSLYMYESMIPGGLVPQPFNTQLYIDVSDYYDKKIESLKQYFSIDLFEQIGEGVIGRAKFRGAQIGVKYAEVFEIVKEIRYIK